MFFQQPQGLANDFARRVVAAGLDLGADELFELGGSETRSWGRLLFLTLDEIAKIVNV
jgi:hypothetical protein